MANHTSSRGKGFVIERGVELGLGQISSQRPTHLNRTDGPTGSRTSAELIKHLAQRDAEGLLDQSAPLDVACQLERERAPGSPRTETSVKGAAFVYDQRHGSQGHDVVDERRPSPQPGQRRNWRLRPHHAALALEAFQHRGLFTTHVGARTLNDADVKRPSGAHDVNSEPAIDACNVHGGAQRGDGIRVFGAHVDESTSCTDGYAGDRHALEEREGIPLHEHAVGEGAAVPLIRVATDVLFE